jgi:hypothetical protein
MMLMLMLMDGAFSPSACHAAAMALNIDFLRLGARLRTFS